MQRAAGGSDVTQQELTRWLSGVHAFITAVNRPVSLRQLLDLVTATACELTGYEFCGIMLVRPDQRRLLMEGAHGLTSDYVAKVNDQVPISLTSDPQAESAASRAFLTAKPVIVNDILADPLMKPWWPLAEQQGYRSLISLPLLVKGKPFGVLNCYASEPEGFPESAVELLGILANQAAGAIEAIHLRDRQHDYIENLARVNGSLRQQSELLQKSEEIHKRLNEVALGAAGLDGLVETLTGLLRRDVVVEDVFGQVLCPSEGRPADLPGSNEVSDTGDAVDIVHVAVASGTSWVMAPIRVAGELVARMWVRGALDELSQLDRRAIENASVIAALEIMGQRSARDIEWRVQGDIISVLLTEHPSSFETLPPRALQLGHDLTKPHHVSVISLPPLREGKLSANSSQRAKEAALSILREVSPRPLVSRVDDYMIVLIPASIDGSVETLVDRVRVAVASTLSSTLTAVSAGDAVSMHDIARTARVARGALSLATHRGDQGRTIVLRDLGVMALLLQLDGPQQLQDFADRTLQPLRAHDAAKSTSLVDTLTAYFAHHCSVSETAQALFVHPNTVKMRLRKVESVLSVDLANADDLLDLRTALLVDEVGRL